MATGVLLYMQRSQQPKHRSKEDGKIGEGSIATARILTQLACVNQDIDSLSESSVGSILKKSKRSSEYNLRLRYSPAAEHIESEFGKRNVHRWDRYGPRVLMSEMSSLRNLRIAPKTRLRWTRRAPWDLAKQVCTIRGPLEAEQGRVLLTLDGLVHASAVHNETSTKRICRGLRCVNAHAEHERFEFSPTTDITANGSIETNQKLTVFAARAVTRVGLMSFACSKKSDIHIIHNAVMPDTESPSTSTNRS